MAIGSVWLGKYRIDALLGSGGMGNVYRAHHLQLDQPVAIKVLLPRLIGDENVARRFLREAQSTVKLRSEHVARVLDVGRLEDGAPYMVMEFLDGYDLAEVVKQHGAQSVEASVDMILHACEGLAEAHAQGIVHRDVKPSNFFIVNRPDGTPFLKILDFGIATAPTGSDAEELTQTQSMIGTPAYMSPEQMRAAKTVDARTDVWSLGVVLYQLLNGHRPFIAENYAELCLKVGLEQPEPFSAEVPAELKRAVLRSLEKDPNQRTPSMAAFAAAVAPFASDANAGRVAAERIERILSSGGLGTSPGAQSSTGRESRASLLGTPRPTSVAVRAANDDARSRPGASISVTGGVGELVEVPNLRGSRWWIGLLVGPIAIGLVAALVFRSNEDGSLPHRQDSTTPRAARTADSVLDAAPAPTVLTTPGVDASVEQPKADVPKPSAPESTSRPTRRRKDDTPKRRSPDPPSDRDNRPKPTTPPAKTPGLFDERT